MAGDWIKIQNVTPDKPEVYAIAEDLGIDPDAVTGKLIRVWIWADQQTYNGHAGSVTKTGLDRITNVTGFTEALLKTGWLIEVDGEYQFPNFDNHNGNPAKQRALGANRKEKQRVKMSRSQRDNSVTTARPEKRREESKQALSASDESQPPNDAPELETGEPACLFLKERGVAATMPDLAAIAKRGDVTCQHVIAVRLSLRDRAQKPKNPWVLTAHILAADGPAAVKPITPADICTAVREGWVVRCQSPSGDHHILTGSRLTHNSDGVFADGELVIPTDDIPGTIFP